ncbi:alpha/beta hydrolase [Bacillus sp. RO3]|nr:alpha/beta hydrolase [Bacillus sp. RO3]
MLHYTTGIYLNGHFDVLQINYQYTRQEYEDLTVEEMDEALKHDVRLVLHRILEDGRYSHIHLVAKSFGTIALCSELERDGFQGAKVIWLTPLVKEDEVFQSMLNSKQEGLCIIGDQDRHFDRDRFKDLEKKPGLEVHVLKGLNHSLEHDFHVLDSISAHKEIMTIMKAFKEA